MQQDQYCCNVLGIWIFIWSYRGIESHDFVYVNTKNFIVTLSTYFNHQVITSGRKKRLTLIVSLFNEFLRAKSVLTLDKYRLLLLIYLVLYEYIQFSKMKELLHFCRLFVILCGNLHCSSFKFFLWVLW